MCRYSPLLLLFAPGTMPCEPGSIVQSADRTYANGPVVRRFEIFNSSDRRYSCSRAPDGGGFVSIVMVLNDGGMVEVATVGREGLIGVSAILNGDPSPSDRSSLSGTPAADTS
jgi:hypothetical protein